MTPAESLTGAQKAAIFVMSLSHQRASEVLSKLADSEIETILRNVIDRGLIPDEVQDGVFKEFCSAVNFDHQAVEGGVTRAFDLIDHSLEPDRAERMRERVTRETSDLAGAFRGLEPGFIAQALKAEHPQTIAVILSQLPMELGGTVIGELPEELRADVVLRVAELEEISSDTISEIYESVSLLFESRVELARPVEGRSAAAKMINQVDRECGESILSVVDDRDAELASQIRKRMLTVNDLVPIQDREFQLLLREVASEDLVISLKTAEPELKDKVLRNLSSRAADQLREDLDMLGPMKLSEVEAAQERVVNVARTSIRSTPTRASFRTSASTSP